MRRERTARSLASLAARSGIVLASFALYAGICLAFRSAGVGLLYLLLVPVVLAGALLGMPGGIVAALLGYALSELLYRVAFPVFEDYTTALWFLDLGATVLVGGLAGYLGGMIRRQKQLIARLEATVRNKELVIRTNDELNARISSLSDALPLCSFCKKIRVGAEQWVPIEEYLRDRTGMDLGPVVCPSCAQEHDRGYLNGREPACRLARICSFFNRGPASSALRELKYAYCYTEPKACEIFSRIGSGLPVSERLLPNGLLGPEPGPGRSAS